jgi:hypothetical protein
MPLVMVASAPTDALIGIATCAIGLVLAVIPVQDDSAAVGTLAAFGALEGAGVGLGITDAHRALGVIDISMGGSLISAASANVLRFAVSSMEASREAKRVATEQERRAREITQADIVVTHRGNGDATRPSKSASPAAAVARHGCVRRFIRGASIHLSSANEDEELRDRKLLRYLRYEVTITPVRGGIDIQGWARSSVVRPLELFMGQAVLDEKFMVFCDAVPNRCLISSDRDASNTGKGRLSCKLDVRETKPSDDRLQADLSLVIAFNPAGLGDVGALGFQVPLPRSSSFRREWEFPACVWACEKASA